MFLQCGGGDERQLLVGVKTALAFHRSEPPLSSSRTGWIMHEYRLAVPRGVAEQRKKNASQVRIPIVISTFGLNSCNLCCQVLQSRRLHSLPQTAHATPNLVLL